MCTLYNLQIPYAAVVVLLPKEVHAEAVPVKYELHFTGTERKESFLQILLKQNTALLSTFHVSVSVQLFSII